MQEELDTTCNRMPHDRLPRIMKHYSPVGRRNRGWPLKTSRYVRPERVNKWPNSMTDIWWWWWWWYWNIVWRTNTKYAGFTSPWLLFLLVLMIPRPWICSEETRFAGSPSDAESTGEYDLQYDNSYERNAIKRIFVKPRLTAVRCTRIDRCYGLFRLP